MRHLLLAIVLFSVCSAARVAPIIYEQDDLGDPIFDEFVYSISTDCEAATIRVVVMDEQYLPVEGAGTFLKYVDFSSPLLSTGESGADGRVLHQLPGNTSLMRGLFILVIEKNGFRSKEVHFDISPCYTDYVPPERPVVVEEEPIENETGPVVHDPVEVNESEINGTEEEQEVEEEPAAPVCPPIFAFLLMFYKTMKA